jgi:hypothetical protein
MCHRSLLICYLCCNMCSKYSNFILNHKNVGMRFVYEVHKMNSLLGWYVRMLYS